MALLPLPRPRSPLPGPARLAHEAAGLSSQLPHRNLDCRLISLDCLAVIIAWITDSARPGSVTAGILRLPRTSALTLEES